VEKTTWMPAGYVYQNYEELDKVFYFGEEKVRLKNLPKSKQVPLLPKKLTENMVGKNVLLYNVFPLATCFTSFGTCMMLTPPDNAVVANIFFVTISIVSTACCHDFFIQSVGKGAKNIIGRLINSALEQNVPELKKESLEYQIALLDKEIEDSGTKTKKIK